MIIKVVPNTIETSSVKQRVNGLSDYIHNPKPTRSDYLSEYIHQLHPYVDLNSLAEKCVYSNSRNFLDDHPKYQRLEMSQTASLNTKVIDPIAHIIGSFKKFEVPTTEQLEEQIDIIVKHLGAENLQMQYAMHMDTDNVHFHLIINKVHPFLINKHGENKVIDLGNGWIHNSLHRAIAEIEAKQGWEPEPNAMFIYNHDTKECEKNPHYIAQPDAEKINSEIRDQEYRHQQKSRISTEISQGKIEISHVDIIVKNVLDKSTNWQDWNKQLAQHGISYEKKRNGAIFKVKIDQNTELTFKASLFCSKEATIKNLEQKWGDFEKSNIPTTYSDLKNNSSKHRQQESNYQHPYHLFQQENFLVKDLHDLYLKVKSSKDSISSLRKSVYKEINFENEIYQNNKNYWVKQFKKKYPAQSTHTIFTLLHYNNQADQIHSRKLQRELYRTQHDNLSQEITLAQQSKLSLLLGFDSSKITSYADFLKCMSPVHHLSMQQQFLFDQRQSRNFIRQNNPEIKTAKIIYDKHQPNEPIAIQNQYGILIFSNYSVMRLYQCIQHLDPKFEAFPIGLPEFKQAYGVALECFRDKQNVFDINEKRVFPSFKTLSKKEIDACFISLVKQLTEKNKNQSTTLMKTCLLLNCCGIDMMKLKSALENCVDQNVIANLDSGNQKILLQKVKSLINVQSVQLNKKYFNSTEIEHCWELYFNLKSALELSRNHQTKTIGITSSSFGSDLRLVPKNEPNENYQHSESLSELDFLQIQQYLEYSQRIKLNKKKEANLLNTFESKYQSSIEHKEIQKNFFPQKKYVVEYKFDQKFYLDQQKIAFFETRSTSEITVVSHQKQHIWDALLLARDKFGVVLVSGTDDFKKQVQAIALLESIKIEFDTHLVQENHDEIEEESINQNVVIVNESSDLSTQVLPTKEDKIDNLINHKSLASPCPNNSKKPEKSSDGPNFSF